MNLCIVFFTRFQSRQLPGEEADGFVRDIFPGPCGSYLREQGQPSLQVFNLGEIQSINLGICRELFQELCHLVFVPQEGRARLFFYISFTCERV